MLLAQGRGVKGHAVLSSALRTIPPPEAKSRCQGILSGAAGCLARPGKAGGRRLGQGLSKARRRGASAKASCSTWLCAGRKCQPCPGQMPEPPAPMGDRADLAGAGLRAGSSSPLLWLESSSGLSMNPLLMGKGLGALTPAPCAFAARAQQCPTSQTPRGKGCHAPQTDHCLGPWSCCQSVHRHPLRVLCGGEDAPHAVPWRLRARSQDTAPAEAARSKGAVSSLRLRGKAWAVTRVTQHELGTNLNTSPPGPRNASKRRCLSVPPSGSHRYLLILSMEEPSTAPSTSGGN